MEVCKRFSSDQHAGFLDCVSKCQCLHHLHQRMFRSWFSQVSGQTQIVTQCCTCMIEAQHPLDSLDCLRRRQELQALLLLCFTFLFFFNAVHAFLNILNEESLQCESQYVSKCNLFEAQSLVCTLVHPVHTRMSQPLVTHPGQII